MIQEVTLPEIADVPLFQGLSTIELRELAALLKRERRTASSRLMTEGEPGGNLFVLLQGNCLVVKQTPSGALQELAKLEPTTCFGEMSFFHQAPISASVVAETEVEVLILSHETYESWLRSGSPAPQKLAWNTIGVLAERLRRMDDWTCQLVAQQGKTDEWQKFRASVYSSWLKI